MVEAWMLRWALRAATMVVSEVVKGGHGVYFGRGGRRFHCQVGRQSGLRGWNRLLRES